MTKRKKKRTEEKEGTKMAALAKPVNNVVLIKKDESPKFVQEFNKNKVSKEFLDTCEKAGKLFGNKRK